MNIVVLTLTFLLLFESNVHATGIGFSAGSEISIPNVGEEVNSPAGFFGLQLGGSSASTGSENLVGSFNVNGGSRFDSSFSSRSSVDNGDQIKANAEAAGKNFVNAIRDGFGGIVSAIGSSFGGGGRSKSSSNSGLEISYTSASNGNKARNSNRGNANNNVELNFNGRSDPSRSSNVGAYSSTNFRTDSRANTNLELNIPARVSTNFNTNIRNEPRGNVEVNFSNRNNAPRVSATSSYVQQNPVRTNSNFEVNFSNRNNAPRVNNNYNSNFRAGSSTSGKSNVQVNFNNRNNPPRVIQSSNNYNFNDRVRNNANIAVNFNNRNNNPSTNSQSANYNFQTKPVRTNTNVEINFSNRNAPAKVSQSANYNLQTNPERTHTNFELNLPARVNFNSNFNSNFRTEPNSNTEVNFNNRNDHTRVSANANTNFRPAPTRANSNVEVNFNNRINPSRASANSNTNVKAKPRKGNSKTSFEINFTTRKNAPRQNSNLKAKPISIGGETGFEFNLGSRHQGNLNFQTESQKQTPVQNAEFSFQNRNNARVTTRKPIIKIQTTTEQDFLENSREVALNTFGEINLSDENQAYSRSTLDVLKQKEIFDETEAGVNFGGGLGLGSNIRSHTVSSSTKSRNSEPILSSGRFSFNTRAGNSFSGASSGTGRLTTDQIFKSSAEKRTSGTGRLTTDQIFKSSAEKISSGSRFNSRDNSGSRFLTGGRLENSRGSTGDFDRRSQGRVSLSIKNNDRDTFNIGGIKSESGFSGSSRSTAGSRFSSERTVESGNRNLGLNFKNNGNVEHRVISTVNSKSKSQLPDRSSADNRKKTTEHRIISTSSKFKTAAHLESEPTLSGRGNIRVGNSRDVSNSGRSRITGGGYGNLDFSTETNSDSLISAGGGKFVDDKDSRELRGDIFVGNSKQDRRGNADFSLSSKSSTRSDSTNARDRFRTSDRDEVLARSSENAKFSTDLKVVDKNEDFLSTIKSKPGIGNSKVDLRSSSRFSSTDSKGSHGGNAGSSFRSDFRSNQPSTNIGGRASGNNKNSGDFETTLSRRQGATSSGSFSGDSSLSSSRGSSFRTSGQRENSRDVFSLENKKISDLSSSSFEVGNRGRLSTDLGFDNEKVPFGVPLSSSGEGVASVGTKSGTAPKVRFSYRR